MAARPNKKDNVLGRQLHEVREKHGWTLRDIERRTKLNNGYLSQLERGDVMHPSPTALKRVADGYGVPFAVVMRWAGYVDDDPTLSPNQAVALSTIGDPSDQELEVIKAMMKLMREEKRASFARYGVSDLELDPVTVSEIRGHALALLDNAGAIGEMPTPLERLKDTARLVQLGELELTPAQRSGLAQRLGGWVHSAWANLLGSLDFEAKTIWVKPGLHHNRQRFVFAHELGHAMLPAHRQAYVDDKVRLSDWVTDLLEREANQAAVELLFQGDRLREQADDSVISLGRAIEYGADFGAGIVATSRRIAEESRKEVAIAIAHKTKVGGLGPTHFYSSASFEERYRWRSGAGPAQLVRVLLKGAGPAIQPRFVLWTDVRGRETLVRVESFFTSYSAIVLFARETGLRAAKFRSELRSGEARALDAA